MTKPKRFRFELKAAKLDDLDDRMLLINLYFTQALTLILSLLILVFTRHNPLPLLRMPDWTVLGIWGGGYAAAVFLLDVIITRFVPDEIMDDGGVNQRIFGNRAVWHIAIMSIVVAICEEMLFRGAIQPSWGPYWTSILFAAIHVRYLRHWLMTGMIFSISYGMGYVLDYTGSLWTPIAAHFLIDFLMGLLIRFGSKEKNVA